MADDTRAPERPKDTLIAAEGIALSYGGRPVLQDIDLAVRPGEIVTLIGPNGAGKTMLVRVLLGLIKPDRGTVARRPGLTIGYMPQRFAVDPSLPLTVRDFLNLPRRRAPGRITAVLEEVNAAATRDRAVAALSGGELQRVLLARALIDDPTLLVLDEPLQGVDFTGQLSLFKLIGAVRHRRGCGVLMVSHDLHLVMAATDRVVCLNRHVCCSGAPEAVSQHPEYVALFGSRAARDLAVYVHEHDHRHDLAGEVVPAAGERPRETSDG